MAATTPPPAGATGAVGSAAAPPPSAAATQVRRLVPDDWAALREARLAALAEAPYAFASTLEQELGYDETAWRGRLSRAFFFGAWQAGESGAAATLAGLAGAYIEQPSAGQPPAWHLISMWVGPPLRGQQVADELVAAICELAREHGAPRVALWVTSVNDRAKGFYRRAGFRETGERQLVRPDEPGNWEERMVRELA